jgi:diadenosine tetraphosphatase ApaH/serine/threonine PP2A family protein phosphatase
MLLPELMATIALLYDIHGNLPALKAVLQDATQAGATEFLLGGDYALFGAWPEETVAALKRLDSATWIRGNGERWTAAPDQAPDNDVVQGAIEACRAALGEETTAELNGLPEATVKEGTRYVHGSPISDVRSFAPTPNNDEDEELLGGATEARIVFGHTHLPFRRTGPNQTELINPGSVGMPFDGDPRAAYALIHGDGRVEHRRVTYDHAASARAVQKRFDNATWTDTVARRITDARF